MTGNEEKVTANSKQPSSNSEEKVSVITRLGARITRFWRVEIEDSSTRTANQLAESRTDLASKRTLMAADRTLMAWVRTALSMISFGFTIYKLLESLHRSGRDVAIDASPENVGLFLIGLGTVSMVMGTIEYWQNIKELRRSFYFHLIRPAFVMALIISITGLFTFISIIAKVL